MTIYARDLAHIQAIAFGDFARRASPGLVNILKSSRVPIRRVYDIGCGAGITTAALVDAGFDVTAVEPSPSLLAIARGNAPRAAFIHASAYDVELRPCDAILAVGEVLTYHEPHVDAEARVRAFFASAARVLAPGGRLVFDLIDADGESLDAKGTKSEDAWSITWETREDRAASQLARHIGTRVRDGDGHERNAREVHHVRLFREAEVRHWLAGEGFDATASRTYGEMTLAARRVAYVATRGH